MTEKYRALGVDPGAKNVGIVLIENGNRGDNVLYSGTVVNTSVLDKDFADKTCEKIEEIINQYKPNAIGIESVAVPRTYIKGKKQLISPASVISLAFNAGAIYNQCKGLNVYMIPPKGNGSGSDYPECLTGHRPKNLPGESHGTRQHERSAYDVAFKTMMLDGGVREISSKDFGRVGSW